MNLASAPEIVLSSWASGLRPDPQVGIEEWANKYRYAASASSPRPGKWLTDTALNRLLSRLGQATQSSE